jgi:RNA polymerase sigma-70 factor (ECF subfamily)
MPGHGSSGVSDDADETTLVLRVQQGDRTAFDDIVERHADVLLRIAYGYLKSRTDAEDLVQDVFLQVWRIRQTWQPQGTIGSYLAVAVRRRAFDLLKHRRIETAYAERVIAQDAAGSPRQAPPPDVALVTGDEYATSIALLEQLSDRFRMVLLLRYAQQRSFAEVAEIMGISIPAARQLAHRALDRLRGLHGL